MGPVPALPERAHSWNTTAAAYGGSDPLAVRYSPAALSEPLGTAPLILDQARYFLSEGRPHDAVPLLREAVELLPLDPDAHTLLAEACLMLGEWTAAVEAGRHAARLSPQHEWSRRLVAFALLKMSRPGEAIVAAREALQIDPGSVSALKAVFEGQLALRLFADARSTGFAILEMAPDAAWPHAGMARLQLLAGDAAAAETEARKALTIAPDDQEARNLLASALRAQGRSLEAVSELGVAVAADSEDRFARTQLVGAIDRYVGIWAILVVLAVGWVALQIVSALRLPRAAALAAAGVATLIAAVGVIAVQRRRLRRIPDAVWSEYKAERKRTRARRYGWVAWNIGTLLLVIIVLGAIIEIAGQLHSDTVNFLVVLALVAALPVWRFGNPVVWRRYIGPRLR